MKAKDYDAKFDEAEEDLVGELDLSSAKRVNQQQKRVNVDFPVWMIESLYKEATRLGVSRQFSLSLKAANFTKPVFNV